MRFQTNFQIQDLPINKIICGDCKEKMQQYLPDNCIDLIYLDPPFFSGRNYEVIWRDGLESRSFRDANWYQKICIRCKYPLESNFLFCPRCGRKTTEFEEVRTTDIQAYLNWLEPRLKECHRILRDTGSIYVHLDWHSVHYVKVILDKLFGYDNFQNEIIWHYRGAGASRQRWARKHDTILFYSKSKDFYFDASAILEPLSQQQLTRYNYEDSKGKFGYFRNRKYYLPKGRIPTDVIEIPFLASNSPERLGYPTQKPLSLLKKFILASSKKGDLLLDPFAGCSTSLVAAHLLKRYWIGIDISPTSCRVSYQRLIQNGARIKFSDIIDFPIAKEDLNQLDLNELKNLVSQKLNLRASEDSLCTGMTFEGVPVLIQKEINSVQIRKFAEKFQAGTIIALSFSDDSFDEIKNLEDEHSIQIDLIRLEELL